MSLTTIAVTFGIVVVILVLYVNRATGNSEELWKRQEARLRAQGITPQRPEGWEAQVHKQRAQYIYSILAVVVLIAAWFAWSVYRYQL